MRCGFSGLNDQFMRRTILSVIIIVLLTLAVRFPLLNIPFERDEGEYAYIGWRLGCHELPYRDWVDQKPPGVFWVYRLALSLPLEPVRSVHIVAMLFSAASAVALFFLARRFTGHLWSTAAASVFTLLSADPLAQGTAANTEVFMLLPLILSQIAFLGALAENRRKIPFMVLCGALCGIAVAFKQVAVVNWALLAAFVPAFVPPGNRWRQLLIFAAWSAAGAAAVWCPLLIYFLANHGLGDFVYNVFTHNLEYIQARPWSGRLHNCIQAFSTLSRSQGLIWLFAAGGFLAVWRARRTQLFLFLAGWMITSLMGVSASGYFFAHYFQQLLPVLALTAALGAERLNALPSHDALGALGWRIVTVLGLAMLPALSLFPYVFEYTPAQAVEKIYPGDAFAEMPALGRRLAQVTSPEDRVFIFGAEPELLFYARRISASRYIVLFPLYGPYRNARDKQLEAAAEISAHRPAAMLLLPKGLFFEPGADQYFTGWVQSYLGEQFQPDTLLVFDEGGLCHLIPAGSGPVFDGWRVAGWLGVRTTK
jgi:hypothetical protein